MDLKDIHSRAVHQGFHSIIAQPGSYQVDIAFTRYPDSPSMLEANKGYRCILILVEVATRYAYIKPMKTKSSEEVAITFEHVIQNIEKGIHFPNAITTDRGKEWLNKTFQAILQQYSIKHYTREDHFSLGIVDRLTRTLKNWIQQYQESNKTLNWVDGLPEVLERYNTHINSRLKSSPVIMRSNPTARENTRIVSDTKGLAGLYKYKQFHVGDRVRVLVSPQDQPRDNSRLTKAWPKGEHRWSYKVYTISGSARTNHALGKYSFSLVDSDGKPAKRTYRAHELKLVSKDSKDVIDIFEQAAKEDRRMKRMRDEDIIEPQYDSSIKKNVISIPKITKEPIALSKPKRNIKPRVILDL